MQKNNLLKVFAISVMIFPIISNAAQISKFSEFNPDIQFVDDPILKNLVKHPIKNAITVKLTESGLNKIENRIPNVLSKMKLNEGSIQKKQINMLPFGFDKINKIAPDNMKELVPILKMVITRLFNTQLNNFSPVIQIENLIYKLEVSNIDLSLASTQENIKNEVILNVSLDINNLIMQFKTANVKDLNNNFIGNIGLNKFNSIQTPLSQPLQIKTQVKAKLEEKGKLSLEFLNIKDNLDKITLKVNFETLQWEKLTGKITTKDGKENQKILNEVVKKSLDTYLLNIQDSIHKMISENTFVDDINKVTTEVSNQYTEFGMKLPGMFANKTKIKQFDIISGFDISQLEYLNRSLLIQMDGYLESSGKNISLKKQSTDDIKESIKTLFSQPTDSDITVAIDTDFINRYLEINFENGMLNNLYLNDLFIGFSFKSSPKVTLVSSEDLFKNENIRASNDKIYLRATGLIDLDLSQSTHAPFLKDIFTIKGTALISLDHDGGKNYKLVLHKIYSDSLVTSEPISETFVGAAVHWITSNNPITLFNEQVKNYVIGTTNIVLDRMPINLISSLNLTEEHKNSIQILPNELFGIPMNIKSSYPLNDQLVIELNF